MWLLDFRVSTALAASTQRSTGDDIAEFDHPAAVRKVLAVTGAPSLQAVVHCYGANTFLMSMLAGHTTGVRSVVCSQVATHLDTGPMARIKAGLHVPGMLDALGVDSLTAYTDRRQPVATRLLDTALRLNPVEDDEECRSSVCHRISFLYGLLFEHAQLDDRIHDGLHELFGVVNIASLDHLATMVRAGHLVDHDGNDVYLTDENLARLDLPILLLSGAENRCYRPSGMVDALELLTRVNGPAELRAAGRARVRPHRLHLRPGRGRRRLPVDHRPPRRAPLSRGVEASAWRLDCGSAGDGGVDGRGQQLGLVGRKDEAVGHRGRQRGRPLGHEVGVGGVEGGELGRVSGVVLPNSRQKPGRC